MTKKLPPLNSLLAFESAARLNSFKKAAEELNQTPSAIAYQIKKLEESLNLELFIRHHKGVELNKAGQSYSRTIKLVLGDLQKETELLKSSHSAASLNILTLHAIAEKWLMPRLADYRRHYPEVNIQITASESLANSTAQDIVIGFSQQRPTRPDSIIFMEEEIFPVCSSDFLDNTKPEFNIENLFNIELLIDAHWKSEWDSWLSINNSNLKLEQTQSISFSLYSMVVDATVKGMGLAMGHKQLITEELEKGLLIEPFKNFSHLKGFYFYSVAESLKEVSHVSNFIKWLQTHSNH